MRTLQRPSVFCILAPLLAAALGARAQNPAPSETPKAAHQAASGPEYVTERGFKSKVFEVKHRDARDLASVLSPLGSGFRGALVQSNHDTRTIVVRDFPENVATMEEALRRLDTPDAPAAAVELQFHVLLASRGEGGGGVPADLKPVVDALRSTLSYRSYRLLTTFSQRSRDGARNLSGSGAAALEEPAAPAKDRPYSLMMEYLVSRLTVAQGAGGPATVRLDDFRFKGWGVFGYEGRVELATDLTLKDGEQVVVGTSVLKDRGIALVVSARLAR
jgi:hypothetical protein